MDYNDFKELIPDYISNKLSPEKKQDFEAYISNNPQSIHEIDELALLLKRLDTLDIPEPSAKMDLQFYTFLKQSKKEDATSNVSFLEKLSSYFSLMHPNRLIIQIGYGLFVLAIGVFWGYRMHTTPDAVIVETDTEAKEETEKVRSQLVLALIDQPSANKRLQAVSEANKLDNVTEIVINALFKTLNNDHNVNVRLAAIESLTKYIEKPIVREGLIKSITEQDSPLVLIALADLMVALQEKESIQSMQELLKKPDMDTTVKQKIKESINHII